jgi:hypothetical protein
VYEATEYRMNIVKQEAQEKAAIENAKNQKRNAAILERKAIREQKKKEKHGKLWTDPETRGFTADTSIPEPKIVALPKPAQQPEGKKTPEGIAPEILAVLREKGDIESKDIYDFIHKSRTRILIGQSISYLLHQGAIKKYVKWGKTFLGLA